jgi:CubicO group peptidase (beta-lactamase class C family)
MTTRRRIVAWTMGLASMLLLGVVVAVRPLVAIGTAYTAKVTCSEVFIARRDVGQVLAQLFIDDLAPLQMTRVSIDTALGMATARLFPFQGRMAVFDPAVGCTLAPAGSPPGATVGHAGGGRPAKQPANDPIGSNSSNRRLDQVLDEAFTETTGAYARRTLAIVVMQRGRVVAERYADGTGGEMPLPGWSMAKSVLNALVGVAVRDGILSLDTPVQPTSWETGDPRRRITVRDLLHMSSGLAFDDDQAAASSDVLRMLFTVDDMASFAASRPQATEPGTAWRYSSGGSLILSRVLRDALGDSAYRGFPRIALFEPLGMHRAVAEADATGTFVLSSYVYATAREWARFGQLYLQDGVWDGRRILPDGWVAWTRSPAPASPKGSYGAHFWLSTPDEYRGPPAQLPDGIFHAVGHEGQFVTIVPSEQLVIVRLGRTRHPEAWQHDGFVAAVLAALIRDS